MQATVVSIDVREGDEVRAGQPLFVLESMKMEHVVAAESAGVVASLAIALGETVMPGDELATIDARDTGDATSAGPDAAVDLDRVRPDLAEVVERHDVGLDHRRPTRSPAGTTRASARRENVADLVDDGSFVEYARSSSPASAGGAPAGAHRTHSGRWARRRHRHDRRSLGDRDVV
jgi:pyruvate/2-oxoglutarate dehydrogenase complex dihydrolipoamide acyltransferase (E2) component